MSIIAVNRMTVIRYSEINRQKSIPIHIGYTNASTSIFILDKNREKSKIILYKHNI